MVEKRLLGRRDMAGEVISVRLASKGFKLMYSLELTNISGNLVGRYFSAATRLATVGLELK